MTVRKRKSKKQSDTKKQSKRPRKSFVFFLERSLESKLVLEGLRNAGAWVEPHAAHFKPTTLDQVWLKHCGSKKWVVLMKDKQIYHNHVERTALLASGVRAFVLITGQMRGVDMAELLTKKLSKIIEFTRNNRGPFLVKIFKDGSIERWL